MPELPRYTAVDGKVFDFRTLDCLTPADAASELNAMSRVTAEKDAEVNRLLGELAAAFARLAELQDELAVALSDAARESDIFYDVMLGEV